MKLHKKFFISAVASTLAFSASSMALAADWSDTALSWRTGNKFAEPFGRQDIKKDIFALTHVSGYKYGTNFFNVDLLQSNKKDPSAVSEGTTSSGAQEVYVLYRHTLDLGKVTGSNLNFAGSRGLGLTAGFDWNTKNDKGYQSKKRMLVLGPTLMLDVPGYLNVSLLVLRESNSPLGISKRYSYKTHPMLTAAWGIPVADKLSFEGYANFIAAKGKDEFGGDTAAETNIDMQLMYDISTAIGFSPKTLKVGLEYQYWKNKFGNKTTSANQGATAKTPMLRVEYHF